MSRELAEVPTPSEPRARTEREKSRRALALAVSIQLVQLVVRALHGTIMFRSIFGGTNSAVF